MSLAFRLARHISIIDASVFETLILNRSARTSDPELGTCDIFVLKK